MATLFVMLDHLAALRQAGVARDPDPVVAAAFAELAGAEGISMTIGRDRGGTQERDLRLLKETVRTALNICLPPQEECINLVLAIRPDLATLTPDRRESSGTERGLDVEDRRSELQPVIDTLKSGGIATSVLVEPTPIQVKAAHRVGAAAILLHTGRFCWAEDANTQAAEFERLVNAAKIAAKLGLAVHAGGGLGYQTVGHIAQIEEVEAIHVGHSLVARAFLVGMGEAVRELLRMLRGDGGR
jgi:pyridoxine 5-phosphate synthase